MSRLNPFHWNIVIPTEYAHDTRVTDKHEIIIRDRLITPEPIIYSSLVRNERGREWVIPAGEMVRVYLNPFSPDHALICEPNDARIGLAHRMTAPTRMDLDGMARVNGGIKHLESHLQRESTQRAQSVMDERTAMVNHNERVMDGEPVTEAEYQGADASRAMLDAERDHSTEPALITAPAADDTFDPMDR